MCNSSIESNKFKLLGIVVVLLVVPAAVEVVLHHTSLLAFRTPPFFVPEELGTPVALCAMFPFLKSIWRLLLRLHTRTHRTVCHIGNAIQYVRGLLDGIIVGHHGRHSKNTRELVHQQHKPMMRLSHCVFMTRCSSCIKTCSSRLPMGNTKTLRTLSTILGYSARRNVQKCTIPRCNTCILATTRTFVFSLLPGNARRTEYRVHLQTRTRAPVLFINSTTMNSRTVCAFLPREFFSCLPGFATQATASIAWSIHFTYVWRRTLLFPYVNNTFFELHHWC